MPELPEVEIIARNLQSQLIGRTILSATLYWERTLAKPSPEEFVSRLQGQSVTNVTRRAKYLVLQLSPDYLLFHLRMSGDLIVRDDQDLLVKHDRLVLRLSRTPISTTAHVGAKVDGCSNIQLVFNDPRKFGRIWLIANPNEVLSNLGPEPFDQNLTSQVFYEYLHAHHRQIKPLLLDQTFIAGLGNIYTDEALHLAGIHPLSCSQSLSPLQAEHLLESIRNVLRFGIHHNGASIDWVYRGGEYQNHFRVYARTGQPCPVCGTGIKRLVVGQRGTHYCPICQPLMR